jgi:hypothetical protein
MLSRRKPYTTGARKLASTTPCSLSLATVNHPMIAAMERKVLEGEVPHSNNLEMSLGRLTSKPLISKIHKGFPYRFLS